MQKTHEQYEEVIHICKDIFEKKLADYNAAWRILRPTSLTDQIFIKINRIRSLEINKVQKISDSIRSEFIGIINYAIITLIQLEKGYADNIDTTVGEAISLYNKYFKKAFELMENKNHDYNEAWRNMRISSFTDLNLMKIFRVKQIEDNSGETLISEGIDANFYDIINYSVFGLIKLEFDNKVPSTF